jgi:hypothetical protein
MAIMFDGPVLPDDLTTFVREVPPLQNIFLNQILPDRYLQTNRVDIGMLTRTGRTARFRAYDGAIHVAKRDIAQLSTVQLPPLSDSLAMGELERLQLEFARTGGTNQAAFVNQIYDDATTLTRNVQRRMEMARGDVLVDGKFTLAGEGGLYLEADYQVPGSNLVTAGVLWSDTVNSDPLSDENSWVTSYINLNGFPPGGQLISRQTLNQLLSNAKLRQATGSILGSNLLLTRPMLEATFDAHMLPPIVGVYDTSFDVDGVSTRVVPANKVIFVPPAGQPLGYTAWGISATALELVNSAEADMTFEQAAGIVGVVEKDGPPYRQYAFVDAVGMPVIENSWLLFVATVA